MRILRSACLLVLVVFSSLISQAQEPQITEFLASNGSGLVDGNGDNSDWIEIYNPSEAAVDLAGWHITDDDEDLTKYTFPVGSVIPAGGYQVVFATKDDTPPVGEWHTNFSLSSGGEYLALVKPDGTTIVSEFAPEYPEQRQDNSYGLDANGVLKYFLDPTPGAINGDGVLGFVGDTAFSHPRGFYENPFSVTVTVPEPDVDIRYTLDGSEPTLTNGSAYSAPISITTTATLRVRAYKAGFLETRVDTQSYLFLADIIQQPADIANYPRNYYNLGSDNEEAQHDYEMDPAIVNDPAYNTEIIDALKAIPTISLVTDRNEMFGNSGFYDGYDKESGTSVEVIYPDSPELSEHADGGVEGHSHVRLKRSLRLNFRKVYGDSSFKTDLFQAMPWNPAGEDEHDVIILRAGNNRAWSRNWSKEKCTFAIDELARQMQLAASGSGMRGAFVHLYINGLYWGMYNAVERADEHFAERYFDGDSDDWHARNHGGALSGDGSRYSYLTGTLKDKDMSVPANYTELQDYLDTDGFIDYMLVQWLNATGDWPNNNWYALNRNDSSPLGSSPMRFFTWDSEWSWDLPHSPNNPNFSATEPWVHPDFRMNRNKSQGVGISNIFNSAKDNPIFMRRLGDRAYQHLMNDGRLSDAAMQVRFTAITDTVKDPAIAESARWGDSLEGIGEPTYTRDIHWQNEVDHILSLMPGRADKLITALRVEGYYPDVDPPIFNQRGGDVAAGFNVTLSHSNPSGIIQYTLDGSDPADGGALTYTTGITITGATQIRTRIQLGAEWSAEDDVTFFVPGPPALVISEFMYNPSGPSAAELTEGFIDDDFEFIEILNRGDDSVELEGIVFTDGIEYTFPQHPLSAGARVIVAANPAAFEFRYGVGFTVFGGFTSGKLSNGGETIRLESALSELIVEITYDDGSPWPEEADGDGFSLIFIDTPGADASSPESWRRSALPGGSPGGADTVSYDTWITHYTPGLDPSDQAALADPDADGVYNMVEYAFDLDPLAQDAGELPILVRNGAEFSVTYDIALFKSDMMVTPQTSEALIDWSQVFYTSATQVSPAGFQRIKVTLDSTKDTLFFRFKVELPE